MKHATWIPRSATIVFRFDIYFGEVSQEASYAVAYVSGAFRDTQIPPFRPRTSAQPSRRFCPSPSGAARCRAHGSGRRLTQTCRQPKSKIRSTCTKDAHYRHLPFSRHWRNARIPPTFSSLVYHFFSRLCCSISSNLARTSPYDVRGEVRNVLWPPHGTPIDAAINQIDSPQCENKLRIVRLSRGLRLPSEASFCGAFPLRRMFLPKAATFALHDPRSDCFATRFCEAR